MTDHNPYEPFKPPFRIGIDGNIYDTQNLTLEGLFGSSVGQRIVDLLNRDAAQEQQPKPELDLEPVRRLILVSAGVGAGVPQTLELLRQAKPALRSLLAEVARLREEASDA